MTPQQADAATLRAIGERMEARQEDGLAALAFFMAELLEDCIELPADLATEIVQDIKTERKDRES